MWQGKSSQALTRREILALSASSAAAFLASCGQPPSSNGDKATFFINPGDSRAASYSFEGQSGTLFGPKDNQGGVLNISHARVDALDGKPQNQALLDFASDGSLSKAILAGGESLYFEWLSASKVIITFRNANGSEEVRFPYDADNLPSLGVKPAIRYQPRKPLTAVEAALLEHSARNKRLHRQENVILPAQLGNPGIIDVKCDSNAVEGATVTGFVEAANLSIEKSEVSFTETSPGSFSYSLPIARAPEPGRIVGSDGYTNSTTVSLSETVQSASFSVPGALQGVKETITADLTGAVSDSKTLTVTF